VATNSLKCSFLFIIAGETWVCNTKNVFDLAFELATNIVLILAGGILSMAVGVLVRFFVSFLRRWPHASFPKRQHTYSDRLRKLTTDLTKASREVDAILIEMARVAQSQESAVNLLDKQLTEMETKERGLQARIVELEQVSIPVADHFAKLLETAEKGNARRDYILFGSGVVVSTVVAIITKLLFPEAA
jgi:hypothetical protein